MSTKSFQEFTKRPNKRTLCLYEPLPSCRPYVLHGILFHHSEIPWKKSCPWNNKSILTLRDATRIIGDLQPVVGPKPSTGGVRYGVPSQSAAESKVFVRFGQWDKMTTMQPTFGVDHIASPLQTGRC
jgi:hypothetical protein